MLLFTDENSSGSSWTHGESVHLTSQERTVDFDPQVLCHGFVSVIRVLAQCLA